MESSAIHNHELAIKTMSFPHFHRLKGKKVRYKETLYWRNQPTFPNLEANANHETIFDQLAPIIN